MSDQRSRGGCAQCRQQHRKCDETRPRCGRCSRSGKPCDFSRELRWAEEQRQPRRKRQKVDHLILSSSPGQHRQFQQDANPSDNIAVTHVVKDFRNETISAPTASLFSTETEDAVEDEDLTIDGHVLSAQTSSTPTELWIFDDTLPNSLCFGTQQTPGEQIAYGFFLQFVSGIIPASDGPQSGYRQLAAHALSSPVLMDTILSVSTRYMTQRGGAPVSLALLRQLRALKTLRETLSTLPRTSTTTTSDSSLALNTATSRCFDISSKHEILAAISLQMTIEMLVGSGQVKTHLTCAINLLDELGYLTHKPDSFLGRWLVQRITFIDISSSFFWCRRPLLPRTFWFFEPDNYYDDSSPSFRDMTGCPHWVLCCLAGISHLTSDSDTDSIDEATIMSKAHEIERQLLNYTSTHLGDVSNDTSRPPRKDLTALTECYYWTAHVLLRRRVYHEPRSSRRVQHAVDQVISLVKSMPLGCGPDSSLSLPLYVIAHEAIRPEQRHQILDKGRGLAMIYPCKTRELMNASFEAMWASMDEHAQSRQASWKMRDWLAEDLVRSRELFIS